MSVSEKVRAIIESQGRTQTWIVARINQLMPEIKMDRSKFSAIIRGNRKMSADELLAFCRALEISPDVFLEE